MAAEDLRAGLKGARRVVIKAGTSVVSTPEGYPSLVRLANIVEQICNLIREGREVLLVTSGAVGIGRQMLSKQARLSLSVRDVVSGSGCVYGSPCWETVKPRRGLGVVHTRTILRSAQLHVPKRKYAHTGPRRAAATTAPARRRVSWASCRSMRRSSRRGRWPRPRYGGF